MVFMPKDGGGMDKHIFIEWAKQFVEDFKDLTSGNRKFLLLYDAYRSHMSLQALKTFEQGGIVAFALPAHTSGSTQPMDVGVFQPFKSQLNTTIRCVCSVYMDNVFDVFDLCRFMTSAYTCAFTGDIIRKSFAKTGIYPFDSAKLIGVHRPLNETCESVAVSLQEMELLLEEKRERRREGSTIAPVVMRKGYLDTKQGLVLTSNEALRLIRRKEEDDARKMERKYNKMVSDNAKFVLEARRRRQDRRKLDHSRAKRHSALYNEEFVLPRSIKERRAAARERTLLKKAVDIGEM